MWEERWRPFFFSVKIVCAIRQEKTAYANHFSYTLFMILVLEIDLSVHGEGWEAECETGQNFHM